MSFVGLRSCRVFSALFVAHCAVSWLGPVLAQVAPMGVCQPIADRKSELGCWIVTNHALGPLPAQPIYWHIDTFPTRAAADAAKGARGTVIEAFAKVWLFTIDGAGQRRSGGTPVAEIGPLPITNGSEYTAQYMETVFTPGMTSQVHRHPGPEAWYAISGETCLETSEGVFVGRPGGPPVIVPGGLPMHLTAIGTEIRRSLVLVLHDSHHPAGSPATDWTPKGMCKV